MRTLRDVEAYLGRLSRRFSAVEGQEGTFLIHSSDRMPPIALRVDPPLVVFRVHIGDAPNADHLPLYRKLLELNARALVHSSFGLEAGQGQGQGREREQIVLCSALELENLDFNELEATLDELDMTLVQQVPVLSELSKTP
jgi:hypothetical protein